MRPVLLRLTALQAAIDVAGHTAKLTGLTAEAAPGKLGGEGQLEWRLTPAGVTPMDERAGGVPISIFRDFVLTGALRLDATDLPMVQPEIPRGFVTGHLDTAWEAGPGRQKLGFTVRDASVALSHVSLPAARGIPRNPSVNNRDWLARLENEESVLAGAGRLEMTIDVPQPVTIAGDDTELRVQGHMALRRQDTHVEVDGGLDVLAGRFVLFDNAFTLRHGRFTLMPGDLRSAADAIEDERTEGASPMSVGRQPGGMFEDETAEVTATLRDPEKPPEAEPLEPIVDLVANGYVVDTDVTVAVRGPARQPQLVLRSQPALAEYQILTLLITGRANALDDSGGDVRREASQLIDRFHNPSLERQVYDRLGVDKLGLAFGDSVDQPILTVGRQIDRELYVETVYHHNAPPTENAQELRIEYQLSPRFSIDTAYGDAAVGNVDLAWKGRFGGEPPAQPLSSLDVGELARPVVEPSVPPQAPVAPATPVAPQTKAPPP